jgi:hypothetical protein
MATLKRLAALALTLLAAALPATAFPAAGDVRGLVFGPLSTQGWFDPLIGSMVARLADGSYAVVWQGVDRLQPRLQWVRPDGTEALEPGGRPLPRPMPGTGDFPVVVAHPVAGAFVAFAARTAKGSRIVVQSFDGEASPRWAPRGVVALSSPGTEDQGSPRLLASPDGGVFVCWLRIPDPAVLAGEVICQRIGPDGRPLWSGGRTVEARPGGLPSVPSLIADGKGGALVFWSNSRRQSLDIEGQRFSPDGLALWGDGGKRLQTMTPLSLTTVLAVPDHQGGAILAFRHDVTHGDQHQPTVDVLVQRVGRDGELLWPKGVTIKPGSGYPTPESLAAGPDGGAFAVVQETISTGRTHLVLYRIGPGGGLPAEGIDLSAPNRYQFDSGSQASFDGGRLRILWTSHVLGSPYTTEVRIAVFDRAGRRLSAPDAAPLAPWGPGGFHAFEGFAFDPERNQGLAVWSTWYGQAYPTINAEGALFSGDTGAP